MKILEGMDTQSREALIHSPNNSLPSAYCVPGIILGSGMGVVDTIGSVCSEGTYILKDLESSK